MPIKYRFIQIQFYKCFLPTFSTLLQIQPTYKPMTKRINNQPKQYSSVQHNLNPKSSSKVQPRNQNQRKTVRVQSNQYRSLQSNPINEHSTQGDGSEINRLDLIFKKEPKDIQEKLMKLLIAYNAVMRYNKQTDMFEVDLLLPFLNQQQKREFIKQFLQVRQQKTHPSLEPIVQRNPNQTYQEEKDDDIYSSKEFKKFSFNAGQNRAFQQNQQPESNQISRHSAEHPFDSSQTYDYEHNYHSDVKNNQQKENQIENSEKQQQLDDNRLKYQQIDSVIAKRLKIAIKKIQKRKEQQTHSYYGGKESDFPKFGNEDKQEESIIDQISNPSFNNTQNLESKQLTLSEYIKEDQSAVNHQPPNNRDSYFNYPYSQEQSSSKRKPYMQIEQQPEEEDYQPLFENSGNKNHIKSDKNKKLTSFEDYTKQLANKNQKKKANNLKQAGKNDAIESKVNKNEVMTAKKYESTRFNAPGNKTKQVKSQFTKDKKVVANAKSQTSRNNIINPSENRDRAVSKKSDHSQSNLKNRKQSPISRDSRKIKNQLDQFMEQHKKKLSKIYAQIKQRINERQYEASWQEQLPQKSLQKFYILVQDDFDQDLGLNLEQIPEESESSEFKQQMLKHYHNQILVNNRNLSSQELVKYFKFLHSNAKKLYIKYLQTKAK